MLSISRLGLAFALVLSQSAAAQPAKPAAANEQPKQGGMQISLVTLTVLVKGTVVALHQANLTGNYSVLRDLGTPLFRERFDQAALTAAFANLRARNLDLSAALLVAPNLTKTPELNQNNELVLVGDFPTQPLLIHFDLRFLQLDGVWRLAGIGVDAVPAPNAQAVAAAAPAPAPAPAPAQQPAPSQAGKKKPTKPNG